MNPHRHSAYMGGVGAGKTFANVVRGLRYATQQKVVGSAPPKGVFLASSFPALKDIVYPAMYAIGGKDGLDLIDYEVKNQTDRKFVLKNGAQVLMRSLDQPDRLRGIEVAWFGIDEGRNFSDDYAYQIMVGRLRQPGYNHAGWVSSTPHGYDWMYRLFHPESTAENKLRDAAWFNAPTGDNSRHLPDGYMEDLKSQWKGRWYEQEVLGRFVGIISGAVFPDFDPHRHIQPIEYNSELPLYAFWDFGIGDDSVCLFAQVLYNPRVAADGSIIHEPQLRIVGCVRASGLNVAEFAHEYDKWLADNTNGVVPVQQWGDPAGGQRTQTTGSSVIYAFAKHGIHIRPAPKRPLDEGIIILQNLMLGDNQFLVKEGLKDVIDAVQTYHWKVDQDGNRVSNEPVHDWTSHIGSALRYGALGIIGMNPRRSVPPTKTPPAGTMGYALDNLFSKKDKELLMNSEDNSPLLWHPDEQVGLADILG
jgi:hypothetical protein